MTGLQIKASEDFQDLELTPESPWEFDGRRMKGLLVAINVPGYYSLPVRILALDAMSDAALAHKYDLKFTEWVNPRYVDSSGRHELEDLIAKIGEIRPDLLGFSMNIWNRDVCIEVARQVKLNDADTCILVGGQEVTNSVIDYLQWVPEFDYLIDGEGELPFMEFLHALSTGTNRLSHPADVSGLRFRKNGGSAFTGPGRCLPRLDENQSVILADLVPVNEKNKLGVLLESSRGCPNRCGFCFEGVKSEKIRRASIERIKHEASHMASKGGRYFHIMDPILCNSNVKRLARLADHFKKLKQTYGRLYISVETYADQITDPVAEHLAEFTMLDIGLQSTNPPTLKAIHRRLDIEKFTAGIERIRKSGSTINIYLILGLPYESARSFLEGLLFALNCRPGQIFVNELLLLNGTDLRRRAREFEYTFDPDPPYTVHATNRLSRQELALLKTISKDVEHRYNLSNFILSVPTPWRPALNGLDRNYTQIRLNGPCSKNCLGCQVGSNAGGTDEKDPLSAMDQTADCKNIELICGDGVNVETIVHAAAQARLAGALRIKLTAPYTLFASPHVVEQLINAGILFYQTFLDDSRQYRSEAFESCMRYFKDIRRRGISLTGNKVHPHVHIFLRYRGATFRQYMATMATLGIDYASLVEMDDLPATRGQAQGETLLQALTALITAGVKHHFSVLLPEHAMSSVLAGNPDVDAIMAALNRMGMISNADQTPHWVAPCGLLDEMPHTE